MPVFEGGAFAGEGEHERFCLIEGFGVFLPVARGVFEVLAEAELEESWGEFVVLFVGGICFDRDGGASREAM